MKTSQLSSLCCTSKLILRALIPWLRVFVEGVVIVGSILLAFGIEAWPLTVK